MKSRQQAIAELRGAHTLRENLAAALRTDMGAFEGKALTEWLSEPPRSLAATLRITVALLAAINIAAVFLALAGKVSPEVPLATLVLVGLVNRLLHGKIGSVIKSADPLAVYELELLSAYCRTLKGEVFQTPLLRNDIRVDAIARR